MWSPLPGGLSYQNRTPSGDLLQGDCLCLFLSKRQMYFLDEIFFSACAEKSLCSKKGLSASTGFLTASFADKPTRKNLLFVEKIW